MSISLSNITNLIKYHQARFIALADDTLLPHGSETGISYQKDYESYFEYIHTGLHSNRASTINLFKTWNDVFYPSTIHHTIDSTSSELYDETFAAAMRDLWDEEGDPVECDPNRAPETPMEPQPANHTVDAPTDAPMEPQPDNRAADAPTGPEPATHVLATPTEHEPANRIPAADGAEDEGTCPTPSDRTQQPNPVLTRIASHNTPNRFASHNALNHFASHPAQFASPNMPTESPFPNVSPHLARSAPGPNAECGLSA